MQEFFIKHQKNLRIFVVWIISPLIFISLLGLLGYMFIIFGGRLVVDEQALVLNTTTTIETTDGNIIAELYTENRHLVDYTDIPDHVIDAFIAIEDQRFYEHAGIDSRSVVRAVYRDLTAFSKAEGASTITQQLAKNLFLSHDKTWMRKTKEAMAALYLERNFSKNEILELYLNAIYFGHGIYGVETAAQKYFSKSITDVTVAEGALLAGIINSPNKYSPIDYPERAKERRNLVLKQMVATGVLSTEQSLTERGKTLGLKIKKLPSKHWNDSYIDLVLKEAAQIHHLSFAELQRGGYRLVVPLNEIMQEIAYRAFQEDDYFPGNVPGVEGAFVMIESATGKIITAIGGRDYELSDLNRVTVKRQPGSTLKPLAVYGPALMQEMYHPYSLIPDEPIDYDGYVARNYDRIYDGEVTIYDALIQSKNAPAVWLLNELGIDLAKSYLDQMNLLIDDQDLAIALGGLKDGLSPLQMAASYQMLANEGTMIEPSVIDVIYDRNNRIIGESDQRKTTIFSSQVAWDLTEILKATVQSGTAQAGVYNKALAGKTGSTEHPRAPSYYKDTWFVGYTPDIVSALWMGYDYSDEHHYLTKGSSVPTELTKLILQRIDQRLTLSDSFVKPEVVESLPEPIELPEIKEVDISYTYGGWPFVKGKLTWNGSEDKRIIYNIYEQTDSGVEKIGQVTGKQSYTIQDISLFGANTFFIVPFDPLTNREGVPSDTVTLSW